MSDPRETPNGPPLLLASPASARPWASTFLNKASAPSNESDRPRPGRPQRNGGSGTSVPKRSLPAPDEPVGLRRGRGQGQKGGVLSPRPPPSPEVLHALKSVTGRYRSSRSVTTRTELLSLLDGAGGSEEMTGEHRRAPEPSRPGRKGPEGSMRNRPSSKPSGWAGRAPRTSYHGRREARPRRLRVNDQVTY